MDQDLRVLKTHSSMCLHSVGSVHQGKHSLIWLEGQLREKMVMIHKCIIVTSSTRKQAVYQFVLVNKGTLIFITAMGSHPVA